MPSSVEPARSAGHHPTGPPGPTPATTVGDGSRVIPFGRRPTRTGRGRRTPQPAQPERVVAPDSPQQRLAETAEAFFLARGATLTDDTTADTYRATLDLVQLMLDGSLAQNLVGEDEYRHLTGMMRGLNDAPDCV
ncbi:hypothetical protein pZL12.15c [Streptomyces phage ZL12]|uniref:Uncharacterized protein n=1 Tax=Streptomyces phage ZL12 TaxID=2570911 RepID=D0UWC0_9CAUD|nr:hypothetical protein QEH43_gp015 [Streptomyces phage ZL12]ACX71092.1 hypothetical protein pZL12.15c [Streptomyces phage ZL12]